MTKTEIVDGIATSAAITKKAAAAPLDAITTAITKELKKGNNVVITGFGTFRVSHRAARTVVNPRYPSEKIKIKAMKVPSSPEKLSRMRFAKPFRNITCTKSSRSSDE